MTRLFAVLACAALIGLAAAPTAAAQGGVPGGPCQTLCILLIVLATMVASCVTGELDQTLNGGETGGWCTDPGQDSLDCWIEDRKRDLGLGPGCTPA